ncbi:hypothetical protein TWF481_009354 [Arthrobotrys musiformis]|uniref:Uncharacterized protein n=1 Tax=Arthrobotrys musiformis TaxID=47236 RepID=A0AAV9W3I6_9PEZI
MATAAYISASQFPVMGQPAAATYDMDPMGQQVFHPGVTGYVPAAAHPQQQIFVTSGQPVQMLTGPAGTVFPQMRFQNPNPNLFMGHHSSGIMHHPYTGDLHTPPAYNEIDAARFQGPRSRRSSFSMSFSAGQYGFPSNQMGQMGGPMDYAYVDNCMLCRANHPPPHPHGSNMGMHDVPAMSTHRQMSMDDNMSTSSKMRNSTYSYEAPPACDPMDWNPNFRSRDRRDSSWDYRSSKPSVRSRSRSQGPSSRSGRVPFNAPIQVSEISDDDSEDDTASRGGRVTNYSNPARRSGSQRPPPRSSSRARPINTSSSNNYL